MTYAIAMLAVLSSAQSTPTTSDIVQRGLHDMTFTARNLKGNQYELQKINKDFGDSYRFQSINVWAKEPFMLRIESRVNETNICYILNGTTRVYSVPRAKIHVTENVGTGPGKRQTWLDFGLLTHSLLSELFQARFVRTDRATGDWVFDLTYHGKFKDTSRHRIWVDPDKRYTTKREWYNQQGEQLATFLYENPKEIGGIWVPTKATVKNVDNRIAGITEYSKIRVNEGISDSLFDVD